MAKLLDMSEPDPNLKLDYCYSEGTGIKVCNHGSVEYYAKGRQVAREDFVAIVESGKMSAGDFEGILDDFLQKAEARFKALIENALMTATATMGQPGMKPQ